MYSQYSEDDYFLEVLKDIQNGSLIEIGAWSPITFSNSRALIERGWSALLVEPSPGPVKDLVREYSKCDPDWAKGEYLPGPHRVSVLAAAVTVEGGLIELQITDDAVSMPTSDVDRVNTWKSDAGFYGRLMVPAIAAADFFRQFGGGVQFVSIDTEGTSTNIFAEMLRVGIRPRCVCLEHDNRLVEIAQYAEQAGYHQVHLNGTNVILRWQG